MKPYGWYSERGGTTFAGEGGRHVEKLAVDREISEGVEEFSEESKEIRNTQFWENWIRDFIGSQEELPDQFRMSYQDLWDLYI